jgi:hypothetical protein
MARAALARRPPNARRAFAVAAASIGLLRCIGPIAPTPCQTDAQCASDSVCKNGVCVYRQGYGEGGAGGGRATDAGADATTDARADE